MTIKFGTDGWRAVISKEFTFENLQLVAQAIANYINDQDQAEKCAVVGYDTRFLSDWYAGEVAKVFAANGINTWLARADAPTPAVSYAIVEKKAIIGVMITASHNPPRYNGVKLKAHFGGSATKEQHKAVEAHLQTIISNNIQPKVGNFKGMIAEGMITLFDPAWSYYGHLGTLLNLDTISFGKLEIIADGMFGAGRGVIGEILARTRVGVTNIRHRMNPGFDGIYPEPIAKNLQMLMSMMKSGHHDLGLATDGDADRIGAVDNNGDFVDPHRIFCLILKYLIEVRGMTGKVVRTVSTTRMIDRICEEHGLEVIEVPVGFGLIADLMMTDDILMGGEESGGMSIKGHIPEGDGILMGLLLLEVVASSGKTLSQLVDDLLKEYGPAQYSRTDMKLSQPVEKADMVGMLLLSAPDEISGVEIERIETTDGVKYYMADGSWLLIRPSGTEPVLRVYAEAPNDERVAALLGFGEEMAAKA